MNDIEDRICLDDQKVICFGAKIVFLSANVNPVPYTFYNISLPKELRETNLNPKLEPMIVDPVNEGVDNNL